MPRGVYPRKKKTDNMPDAAQRAESLPTGTPLSVGEQFRLLGQAISYLADERRKINSPGDWLARRLDLELEQHVSALSRLRIAIFGGAPIPLVSRPSEGISPPVQASGKERNYQAPIFGGFPAHYQAPTP